MADEKVVIRAPDSREEVAFKLLEKVMNWEGGTDQWKRKEILDTFAECLQAASGYRRLDK